MKKPLFATIIAIPMLVSSATGANLVMVDALIADAVAACAKIDTLESGDIKSMLETARALNNPGSNREVVNVDIKFSISDGLTSMPVSRRLEVGIHQIGNKRFSLDCSVGYQGR